MPACTFVLMKPGRFFGHRQTAETRNDSGLVTGTNAPNWAENLTYEPPTALMVDGVHQSISQPLFLSKGPYSGDFIVGDNNSPGLSRVALDKVGEGQYNGTLLFFTGGFGTAAINRLALHTKEDVVVAGTFLNQGDWPAGSAKPLYRISMSATASAFEIRGVHSRAGGVEIRFSQPVSAASAVAGSFVLSQWHYTRSETYGCCIDQKTTPTVASLQVSDDKRRIFLAVNGGGAAQDRLLKIVAGGIKSETGAGLFTATAYFTHNYQGTQAFHAGSVALRPGRPAAADMASLVRHERSTGGLTVRVGLSGEYSLSLRGLDGAFLDRRVGAGPGEFRFPARAAAVAVHILTVESPEGNGRFAARVLY